LKELVINVCANTKIFSTRQPFLELWFHDCLKKIKLIYQFMIWLSLDFDLFVL
jgi:hypothetical protein